MNLLRCYACNRPVGQKSHLAIVKGESPDYPYYVGRECYKLIQAAGPTGYQPPLGGPILIDCDQDKAWEAVNRTSGLYREF